MDTQLDMHVEPEPVNGNVSLQLDLTVGTIRLRCTARLTADAGTELCSDILHVVHRITRSGDSAGGREAPPPLHGQDQ